MPPISRPRILNFRKVEFFTSPAHTLEKLFNDALDRYTSRADRTIWSSNHALDCLAARKVSNEGTYFYIVGYTAGDLANAVNKSGNSDLKTVAPPANSEFIDGAAAVMIKKNEIFYCGENMRENSIQRFISEFIKKQSAQDDDSYHRGSNFTMSKKASDATINQLAREGVASINLDAGVYEAERQYSSRTQSTQSMTSRLIGPVAKQIKALTSQDDDLASLHQDENLFINLEIKFNRVLKGGSLGQERVKKIAADLMNADEGGFTITTLKGNKIRHDEMVLKKSVNLPIHGKAFQHLDAWRELKNYQQELARGHLATR